MPWFRLDDGWHNHPKVLAAGNAGAGLWARCGDYCAQQLTDGFVPAVIAEAYGTRKEIDRVTASRLWTPVDGGFLIEDYLEFNPTAEQVKAERAAAAERQRRSRASRRDSQGDSRCESQDPGPARPDPDVSDSQQQQNSDGADPRLAAALDLHTTYRTAQGDVVSPPKLRSKLWKDHAAQMRTFLRLHPDCTEIDLAVEVLGMERPRPTLVPRAACTNPECVGGHLPSDPYNEDPRRHTTAVPCPECNPPFVASGGA